MDTRPRPMRGSRVSSGVKSTPSSLKYSVKSRPPQFHLDGNAALGTQAQIHRREEIAVGVASRPEGTGRRTLRSPWWPGRTPAVWSTLDTSTGSICCCASAESGRSSAVIASMSSPHRQGTRPGRCRDRDRGTPGGVAADGRRGGIPRRPSVLCSFLSTFSSAPRVYAAGPESGGGHWQFAWRLRLLRLPRRR